MTPKERKGNMKTRLMAMLLAAGAMLSQNCVAYTIHTHHQYDGPWHWEEVTSKCVSLDGTRYPWNGVLYPVLIGNAYSGTAESTGRYSNKKTPDLVIASKIGYE
jgi:hypothetical protein